MKQLIPQSIIDEAAKEYAAKQIEELNIQYDRDIDRDIDIIASIDDFKDGVQFALNEIEPLMVEFAEWSHNQIAHGTYIGNLSYEDMMKEFIKFKNMPSNTF